MLDMKRHKTQDLYNDVSMVGTVLLCSEWNFVTAEVILQLMSIIRHTITLPSFISEMTYYVLSATLLTHYHNSNLRL